MESNKETAATIVALLHVGKTLAEEENWSRLVWV